MTRWNTLRKAWYSWLRKAGTWIALFIGSVFLFVALVQAASGNLADAAGWLVAGGPLTVASIGLINSTRNEPKVTLCTSEDEIKSFMREFILCGSTVHIASYHLSWVRGDEGMRDLLVNAARNGKQITVFAAGPDQFTRGLSEAGIQVVNYSAGTSDRPRFTLLNLGRSGAEQMAVARGGLPNHWIDVYEDAHHPQVIALARAYIQEIGEVT